MAPRPGLSKGEMEVAQVLWNLGSASVRQVHEAFPAERQIDFATVANLSAAAGDQRIRAGAS